jgi:hypothetical protein
VTYNVEDFLTRRVQRYMVATDHKQKLKAAATPFLPEDQRKGPSGAPSSGGPAVDCLWCLHACPFNEKLQLLETPGQASRQIRPKPIKRDTDRGELATHAAGILMKILYGARLARFDFLRAVAALACRLTNWTADCDRRLCRLVCYIHSTKHLRVTG